MRKKIILFLCAIFTAIAGINVALAAVTPGSSATFTISGPTSGKVGDTLTYTIKLRTSERSFGFQTTINFSNDVLAVLPAATDDYGESVSQTFVSQGNFGENWSDSSKTFVYADMTKKAGVIANSDTAVFQIKLKAAKKGTITLKTTNSEVNCSINKNNDACATINQGEITVTIGDAAQPTSSSTSKATSSSTSTSQAQSSSSSKPTPQPSQNNNAATLGVSGYSISPSFSKGTKDYTVTVPADATFVTIFATAEDSKATISGTGNFTLTGNTSTATVVVTSESGAPNTYTITINKQTTPEPQKDGDNSLKDLTVGGKTIDGFDKDKTNYTIEVGEGVTALDIVGIPNASTSSVTVSGGTNLQPGNNVVTITVQAEDGSKRVYTINVKKPQNPSTPDTTGTTKKGEKTTKTTKTTRKPSSETGVTTINIGSPHTISPAFSNDVDVYNVTVPYDVEQLDLSLYLKDSNAKYTVTGNENFQVGKINVVTVKITAEDGTTRTIIFNVTRTTDEDGTRLIDIGLGGGYDIQPGFDPDILGYTINVPGGVNKLDLNPKAPEGSTVKTYGNENLKEGWNTVLVSVTDKNGYTRTYTLSVYKEPKKILGLTYRQFAIVAGIIGGLLLTFFLILLLLGRRKKREEAIIEQAPVIDFKPEFNFGSRNGTDDDTVYPNGMLNQDSKIQKDVDVDLENANDKVLRAINSTADAEPVMLPSHETVKEIPYDPYDDVVTKDELIDAIEEGLETKNPEKLKILLEQEELNRKKEDLKRKNGGR